ncbi:MAG: SdiA-regulated domain-containing protein [Bacteroidota bacterium]|nr:SdiA-regulated domain-containing protein [Bacteroidota bacterium]
MRVALFVAIVVLLGGFIFWKDIYSLVKGTRVTQTETLRTEGDAEAKEPLEGIQIAQKWEMPSVLKEISGIAYIDSERMACIQDEQGVIYIYNRGKAQIEKEIPFAEPGDFEDITLVGETAWVVRADGKLFEVDMRSSKPAAKQHSTPLTVKHNVEGLAYDKAHNRLLLAIKEDEPKGSDYKGIYGFDLATKKMLKEPVYKIDLQHEVFAGEKGKKAKGIKPSAIAIHPATGNLYITDGPRAHLLVMDGAGKIKDLLKLGKAFEQPEGLSFGPGGELYISNEGNKGPGNILQVILP